MSVPAPRPAGRFPWGAAILTALSWLVLVGVLEWRNPRLIPSWHGFLHTAIVTRFPSPTLVPENPFFAGEPLPYYWVYHGIAAVISTATSLDALAALHLLTLLSLAAFVIFALDAGRRLTGSTAAGVLIGFLALAGANPGGPLIAAAHRWEGGGRTANSTAADLANTVFVENDAADRMMSRPLLAELYFGGDWRSGQNLVWFWDVSSRAPALATLMLLVWVLIRGSGPLGLIAATFLLTALSPLVGIAAGGALAGALAGFPIRHSRRLVAAGALVLGVALALPTFIHLFQYSGAAGLSSGRWMLLKATYLTLNYGLLAALACWACLRTPAHARPVVLTATLGGLGLLALAVVAGLAEGNEHNFANAAGVLLAVPAGAAPWYGTTARHSSRTAGAVALVVSLIYVPVTVGTVVAFDARPPLPFRYVPRLERTPAGDPMAALYAWIRRETPRDAVLIADPDRPIKMSGNVSEIPAFTDRVLFVDQEGYLTTPHLSFAARSRLARALIRGEAGDPADRREIDRLGRSVYLVSTAPERLPALERFYGPARFTAGPVGVFLLTPEGALAGVGP